MKTYFSKKWKQKQKKHKINNNNIQKTIYEQYILYKYCHFIEFNAGQRDSPTHADSKSKLIFELTYA